MVSGGASLDAAIDALTARVAALESAQAPRADLQGILDAAAPNSTMDLTGRVFRTPGVVVRTAGLTIVGGEIVGPGDGTYDSTTRARGIDVAAAGVTIERVTIHGYAFAGVFAHAVGLTVIDSTITDCAYAGIIGESVAGGVISGNHIARIGTRGRQSDGNAYGLTLTSLAGEPPSHDVSVLRNVVEDVPTWHAFDTHGGQRISFVGNLGRRARRIIVVVGGANGERPRAIITDNVLQGPSTTGEATSLLLSTADVGTIERNIIAGYGPNPPWPNDAGGSTYRLGVNRITP